MNQKGITLIALIITIIILLILAGVTINMVLGNDGIIAKAQATNQKQVEAALIEEIKMYEAEKETAKYGETQARGQDVFIADLYEKKLITKEQKEKLENGEDIIIKQDDKEYIIKGLSGTTPVVPEETPEITNSNIASYTTDGVPIPKGFEYVEGTKDEGVVIKNTTDENEFVWVPVEGELELKKGYAKGSEQSVIGREEETAEYLAMKESVATHGGFYVGRYETGSNIESKPNVFPYTVAIWEETYWNELYDAQAGLYTEENKTVGVVSGMIWGSQWDAIMTWMSKGTDEEKLYVKNSMGKGNYAKLQICNECIDGRYCYECNNAGYTKGPDDDGYCEYCSGFPDTECEWCAIYFTPGYYWTWNIAKTGSSTNYKVKNIFDLAGNCPEYTQELITNGFTDVSHWIRGGGSIEEGSWDTSKSDIGYSEPVSIRYVNNSSSIGWGENITSRMQLYIK